MSITGTEGEWAGCYKFVAETFADLDPDEAAYYEPTRFDVIVYVDGIPVRVLAEHLAEALAQFVEADPEFDVGPECAREIFEAAVTIANDEGSRPW